MPRTQFVILHGGLATLVAVGLLFSIVGSWRVMRSTPIYGEDRQRYGAIEGGGSIEKLVARQQQGWWLLLIGFVLQFSGAVILAARAFLSTS